MASDATKTIYQRAMLGHRMGFGRRPALLVVDMQVGFTRPEKCPLAGELGPQIAAINRLIGEARTSHVPIIFTAVGYEPNAQNDGGIWAEKIPSLRLLKIGSELVSLDPQLDRQVEDRLIVKKYASCFFGTHLLSTLTSSGIDTLIVTGCTTSGCIRATVIDAISYGFRPIVAFEAVGDRAREPHENNLFDISSKYADVMPLNEVLAYLKDLVA